jgi:hypothetical protein
MLEQKSSSNYFDKFFHESNLKNYNLNENLNLKKYNDKDSSNFLLILRYILDYGQRINNRSF